MQQYHQLPSMVSAEYNPSLSNKKLYYTATVILSIDVSWLSTYKGDVNKCFKSEMYLLRIIATNMFHVKMASC